MQYVVRIVLSKLEQSFLTYFEEFCLYHVRVIVLLRMPTQRVAENKSYQDQVKKCKWVQRKVREKCKANHLQESLFWRFDGFVEKTSPQGRNRIHLVNCLVKLIRSHWILWIFLFLILSMMLCWTDVINYYVTFWWKKLDISLNLLTFNSIINSLKLSFSINFADFNNFSRSR